MDVRAPQLAPLAMEESPALLPAETLTRREHAIITRLARGATDREIAETLTIAVSTVGVHVHHILGKLGLNSRWQVADWAVANGLTPAQAE